MVDPTKSGTSISSPGQFSRETAAPRARVSTHAAAAYLNFQYIVFRSTEKQKSS
jgi:hypothetical protein